MKSPKFIYVLAGLALAGLSLGQGGKMTMIKPARKRLSVDSWQRMYDGAARFFDRKDAAGLYKVMTPDFTMSMNGKTYTSKEAQASMTQWFGMMKDLHCSMKVSKVTQSGNQTIVVDNFHNWGHTKPDPKTHKSGKFVDTGTETGTWVNMGGKWMLKRMVTTNEKMTIDGKPVKM